MSGSGCRLESRLGRRLCSYFGERGPHDFGTCTPGALWNIYTKSVNSVDDTVVDTICRGFDTSLRLHGALGENPA